MDEFFTDEQLRSEDIDTLKERLHPIFGGYGMSVAFIDPAQTRLFRAIKWDRLPTIVDEVSCPPLKLAKMGRLNRDGEQVLYCSRGIEPPLYELHAEAGQTYAVSEWVLTEPLWMLNLGYHRDALHQLGGVVNPSRRFVNPAVENENSPNEILRRRIALNFVDDVQRGSEHRYKQTIAINELLASIPFPFQTDDGVPRIRRIAGTVYPTIRNYGAGDNIVFKKEFVESSLKLVRVQYIMIQEATSVDRGYRTREGFKFTDTTVKRLIQDPTAKGLRRANYTKQRGDRKHWHLKPENEWVILPVEPIVSEELWNSCNALLTDQSVAKRPRTRRPVHLFGGITYCRCGEKMHAKGDKGKYDCPACHTKIPMADLEGVFREQLQGFVTSPENLTSYVALTDQALKERRELLAAKERERHTVSAEMDRLYRLYMDEGLSIDEFRRRYGPLEEQVKQIDRELPRLHAELDILKIHHISREEVFAEASDLYARWSVLSHEEKRTIVEAVTDKIVVGTDEIEVNLSHIFPPEMAAIGQRSTAAV
ncbi:recombinase family protein [Ferrovibrio sp.]|uniref:recombinase family protein n=1 Tax=Ferrovibrio sp. TaxID=1917215 RepID=UPI002622DB7F|nr:recombinase family protein [Ferrovibrio sp.]